MVYIRTSDYREKNIIAKAVDLQVELVSPPVEYYRHGWQSWSLAAWTDLKPLPKPQPALLHTLQVDAEYVHEQNPNGSWLGAVQFTDGDILLLGALTLDTHVFLDEKQLRGRSAAGEAEWFIAYGKETLVFEAYAAQLGARFGRIQKTAAPRAWCSWYSLYTAIDEEILHRTFDQLSDLPFTVLQVDDGWQKKVGDWDANEKFPAGMAALADKIKATGRKAGLWLAPLIATASSQLFREHPDWFLRDAQGKLVDAGFNWGECLFALDTTQPAVSTWLIALMKKVRAWGFDYLKLDFLYGGALQGQRFQNTPREAAYREALFVLREAMGADAFFLTCGTPILPALGVCDAIRVGPDVAGHWEDYRDAMLLYNPAIPATRNAIRTSLNRLWLDPLLQIDPDVAYFAVKENRLTPGQKRSLQDLALICNFKATSDMPQWLSKEEREELREFLNSNPTIERTGRYTFTIDGRIADFTPVMELPTPPAGLGKVWGGLLGWLGSQHFILRILSQMDAAELKKKRARL